MKKYFLILVVFFLGLLYVNSQKINQTEFDYLIKRTTKKKSEQQILQKVHEHIIRSEYDIALELIQKNSHKKQISYAASTYLAAIEYVKSNYEKSLIICDSLIISQPNKSRQIYLVRAMNYKAKALSAMGRQSDAINVINKSIELAKKNKDRFQLAMSYYYKGVFIAETGDFKNAIQLLKKSKKISKELNDKLNLAAASSFIGYCYSHEGKYAEAIQILNESILIRSELGDKRGLANSYLNLNKVYLELEDQNKRFEYENKSLEICTEIGDLQCISGRLTNIGDIYFHEGKLDLALKFQKKAHRIAKKIGINYRVAEIHQHLAEIFNEKKEYQLAISHIDSSIQIRNEIKENEGVAISLIIKANILLKWGQTNKAKVVALEAIAIGDNFNLVHIKRDGHLIMSQILEKNGDGQMALNELKTYHIFKDRLLNIDKSKLILRKELEENFKLKELNNKKIQSENRLKLKQEKAQRKILINISVSIIALLLIFAYIIYLKYQSQKKLNDVVTQNQVLTNQLSHLEKESIFSQTIFSIAHELNTPLGVIKAGAGEMIHLISEFNESTTLNLNDNKTTLFLEKWDAKCNFNKLLGGRERRKLKQQIFDYIELNFNQRLINREEVSNQIAELNLKEDLFLFVDELFQLNEPTKVLQIIRNSKKITSIENAVGTAINTTQKVVQEMNQLAQIQSINDALIDFEIKPIVNQIINLNPQLNQNKVEIISSIEGKRSLFFDKDRFIQIISVIIQNAIESFEDKERIHYIKITYDSTDSFDVVSISNNGKQIPDEIRPIIFERFTTTKNRSIHRGIGLSIVKSTLESYGGYAEVHSNEHETSFKLYFRRK